MARKKKLRATPKRAIKVELSFFPTIATSMITQQIIENIAALKGILSDINTNGKPVSILKDAPQLAAADIPKVKGLAIGFFSIDCI